MKSLREHRRSRLMSIEDLATKSGVSTKTIVDTEHGRTTPKFRTIRKLSAALDMDPLDIDEFAAVIEGTGVGKVKPGRLTLPGGGDQPS